MPNELIKLIEQFPDKPWDWISLCTNPNITVKSVLAHLHEILTNMSYNHRIWNRLSSNPGITMKDIRDYPDKPWNWDKVERK